MALREATPADLDDVCRLIRSLAVYEKLEHEIEWTTEQMATELFGPDAVSRITLACDDASGDVVGMALWFWSFSTFVGRRGIYLEDLFVDPAARSAGHGRALLAHLMAISPARVEWAVLDWNTPSIAFYDSLGAEPVEGWLRYRYRAPSGSGGRNRP